MRRKAAGKARGKLVGKILERNSLISPVTCGHLRRKGACRTLGEAKVGKGPQPLASRALLGSLQTRVRRPVCSEGLLPACCWSGRRAKSRNMVLARPHCAHTQRAHVGMGSRQNTCPRNSQCDRWQ